MTMMTPERTAKEADLRLLKSHSSTVSDCSEMIEEKKSMDDGDLMQCFQKECAIDKQRMTAKNPVYRNMVSNEPGSKFLPEKGRYVLYVSLACPNSQCALMVRTLKGLDETIAVQYVRPHPKDHLQRNWVIRHEIPDDSMASLKSHEGEFQTLREIYQHEHDNTSNTIPLLYDQEHQCIVNNNANDICTMFNAAFGSLARNATLNLYPDNEAQLEDWLYPLLQLTPSNVPPYHYNLSARQLQYAFDHATALLQKQRYLLSNTSVSAADLRLFAALVRYDAVYARYLECPPQLLHNPVLMDYCRDLYQQPGMAATVNLLEIQKHFLGNSNSSTALMELLDRPHKRSLM